MAEEATGTRTETIVRQYDTAGALVSEVKTVVTVVEPQTDAQPFPGCYP